MSDSIKINWSPEHPRFDKQQRLAVVLSAMNGDARPWSGRVDIASNVSLLRAAKEIAKTCGGNADTIIEMLRPLQKDLLETAGDKKLPPDINPAAVIEDIGVVVLGETDDQAAVVWVVATRKQYTARPSTWRDDDIVQMLGGTDRLHFDQGSSPPSGKYRPLDVKRAVAAAAGKSPRIHGDTVVGQGVFKHGDRLLIVKGAEAAIYDGEKFAAIDDPKVANRVIEFAASKAWGEPLAEFSNRVLGMTAAKAKNVLDRLSDVFDCWHWKHDDAETVAALVVATFIQDVWTWRPLITVSGASDTGKSTLFDDVLANVFGSWTVRGDRSTEAGIRQKLATDRCPVLVDEFDKYRHRQQVLELFRTASRGGTVLRGTQDQRGKEFGVKHIGWFAGIETGQKEAADRNRSIRLDLLPPKNRGSLSIPGPTTLAELGHDAAAAAVWVAAATVKIADTIKSIKIEGVHGRVVESFSVPAAVVAVMRNGTAATPDQAVTILQFMLADRESVVEQGELDQVQLLRDILGSTVRVPIPGEEEKGTTYHERTVRQLLDDPTYADDIEAKGVKIYDPHGGGPQRLFIDYRAASRNLLKGTRWEEMAIDTILLRLPKAERVRQRCGGDRPWGASIPLDESLELIDGESGGRPAVPPENGPTGQPRDAVNPNGVPF